MYVCMYICMYTFMHTHVNEYTLHVHASDMVHTGNRLRSVLCVGGHERVYVCIYIYICMHVSMYVNNTGM